ncbi:prephenate dehydratase [Limnochorda pilosa]|uniref:prephenate dehydratase n=1 Tax=Limnochorda pilosa TaxID=1555112 RepID=UPI0026F34C70|nr:prephenate dehydratase [Limnochorda pilosa]
MGEFRVGYLGPEGSHSEAAAEALRSLWPHLRSQPQPTLDRLVLALVAGELHAAVVPVENSIEGSVDRVLDLLAETPQVAVRAEWVLPVEHHLLGRPGQRLTGKGAPLRVLSHPQALGQCRNTLAHLLPEAEPVPVASTAEAARRVALGSGPEVCVAGSRAAQRYGLVVLHPHVQDRPSNRTRFWLLAPAASPGLPGAPRKTAIVFGFEHDRPGNLYRALAGFARWGVNLTRLESRPVGDRLGLYRFFTEVDGALGEPRVIQGLEALRSVAGAVRVLGEYPVWELQEGRIVTTERATAGLPGEVREKLNRIERWLDEKGYDALLLQRRDNFAWLTGGARSHIPKATAFGESWIVVRKGSCTVVTNNIEAGRMLQEELPGHGWQVEAFNWWEPESDPTPALLTGKAVSDGGGYGTPVVHQELQRLRVPLTVEEQARYRQLGLEASEVLEMVARRILPGQTEWEIAAQMEEAFWARGIEPTVILVAGDERLQQHRHPLPTANRVHQRVMLVACARRHGLIANLTRLVSFAPLDEELRRRHRACCTVDAALFLATRVGTPYAHLWETMTRAYAAGGFPGEWQRHHQGGPTGYEGRDWLLMPGREGEVEAYQAYAWNPSITGTKSEDTMLATPDGPQWLTEPQDWPTIEVEWEGQRLRRPDILVRAAARAV